MKEPDSDAARRATAADPDRPIGGDCRCEPRFEDDGLVLVADACPGRGDLAAVPPCRAAAVRALDGRGARGIRVVAGVERVYADRAVALLVAAGRFADLVAGRDGALARLARRDPLAAAARARGRSGRVADLAAETGLALVASSLAGTPEPIPVAAVRDRRCPGGAGDRT